MAFLLWHFSDYILQIRKEDKSEVEQNIRDALESICTPDDVERELRAALTTLNLDTKEDIVCTLYLIFQLHLVFQKEFSGIF